MKMYGILIYKYTKEQTIFEGHQNFWEFVKNAEINQQCADGSVHFNYDDRWNSILALNSISALNSILALSWRWFIN